MSELAVVPDLVIRDGRAFASSRDVAAAFGKRHDNVLRQIDSLVRQEAAIALNFEGVSYLDEKGEARRAFDLTRDGFTLLAMGFTGQRALRFKLVYIEKFNAMEAELRAQADAAVFLGSGQDPVTRSQLQEDLRAAFRHFAPQVIQRVVDSIGGMLPEAPELPIPQPKPISAQAVQFAVGAALDKEMTRILSGMKGILRNQENWKAAGLLPSPIPTDDTTYITATEVCWMVLRDTDLHRATPGVVGQHLLTHARTHCWPQGQTLRRRRGDRPVATYPVSRIREWLDAGGRDFIRDENEFRHLASGAVTSEGAINPPQGVIRFPGNGERS